MDHSSLAAPQFREPEKACVSQPSSTTLDLPDGVAQTFIVELASLCGRDPDESRKDVHKSTPTGEHQTDNTRSVPPSPHEPPEKTPLPPLSVDVPSSSLSPTTDSGTTNSPIEPPGLPRNVDDAIPEVKEIVLPVEEDRDMEFERATPSCFSLSDVEPLRTLIPDDLLPDDLLVFDPDNISKLDASESHPDKPVRYVRVFPQPKASQEPPCADASPAVGDRDRPGVRVARLYLKENNVLGGGHHSSVYSAPLRLRLNAESEEESTVRVGVKTAFARCGAHEMLRREAVAYNAFPRHLMEDKFPAVKPPQPASSPQKKSATPEGVVTHGEMGDATDTPTTEPASAPQSDEESMDEGDKCSTSSMHTPPHEPAVVPKFFGYYAAVDADGRVIQHAHPKCDKDATCAVPWPTRLLLVEECGTPVVLRRLTYDQRTACFQLFKRLHAAGFTQGSIYERNILVQPGPLSVPPEDRSDDTPSFRIIDFGRMQMRGDFKSPGSGKKFAKACEEEREWAYDVLVESYNRWY